MLTTGWVERSPHNTTSRLLTIVALRSSSSSTTSCSANRCKGEIDHSHGSFDDPLSGGHHGARLLSLQHRLCDLGRVRKVGQP